MRKSLLLLLFLISSICGFATNEIIESQSLPIERATTYVQTTAMLREGLIDINAFDSYDYLQDSDGILYAANASESLEAVCLGLIEAPNEYANITIKEEIIFNGESYNVVEIANSAFFDCTFLQDITLPATIKKIGFRAFAGCTNLESVIFPESLQIIETEAFNNCI
ncbi:MAG: leucine-rich repeat protein [Bacteroidaceae bacterium]|nr:leucine-rich repeat protein [Bacteroidaceae bacterium]